MKKIIIMISFILIACISVYAVDNNKPETHNTSWEKLHGQAAIANEAECMSCHDERVECIGCHEDKAPRNHSIAWVQKNHGLEARWNRMDCGVCHKEDFCSSCHEDAVPRSHARAGFGVNGSAGFHCTTGCQLPYGTWTNTPAKNCIVCHKTRPMLSSGALHAVQ